jgi:dynein regulatory complex protein 1
MHITNVVTKAKKVFNDLKLDYEAKTEDQRMEQEKLEQTEKFKQEQKREERFEEVKENTQKTSVALAELDMKLGHFEQLEDCENLKNAVKQYKKDAGEIIAAKNALIIRMKDDLQLAEEYYVAGIAKFHNEFQQAVSNGKKHFENCREKALQQLVEVETELLADRLKILNKNKAELNALFEAHTKTENDFQKFRESEEERNLKELSQIRQDRNREYSELKLVLETEIQNHEKCLEDMKAIYQLNQEKLTYNFKVLTEKKEENTALTMILRKKERFFLNLLKKKNDDFNMKDIEFRKKNNKLTEQSKMITKQYRELHKKFEHFEKADVDKYDEIKQIALKSITDLKSKIVNCHRVIMNQQLGIALEVPEGDSLDQLSLTGGGDATLDPTKTASIKQLEEGPLRSSIRSSKVRISTKLDPEASQLTEDNINLKNLGANFTDPEKWTLLHLVLKQMEFLFDDKIISEIDALDSPSEQMLRKLDLLMKVFSLKSPQETHDWLFKVHLQCMGFEEQTYDEDLIPQTISRLLENKKKIENNPNATNQVDSSGKGKASQKLAIKEKGFWKSSSQVLDEETIDRWRILDKQLAKYYQLLKQRREIILSNEAKRVENESLQKLLEQYMQQEVKLIYPPSV